MNVGPLKWFHEQTGVWLIGEPDAYPQLAISEGSAGLLDYTTSHRTGNQSRLYPIHRTQLNAYAFLLPGHHSFRRRRSILKTCPRGMKGCPDCRPFGEAHVRKPRPRLAVVRDGSSIFSGTP